MPNKLWGASGIGFNLPERPFAILLFGVYTLLFLAFLIRNRQQFRDLAPHKSWQWLGLAAAALIFSQLFPLRLVTNSPWLGWLMPPGQPVYVAVLAAFPLLLAAYLFGPVTAVPIGFLTGLGIALGQSYDPFMPFHIAFAAGVAGVLLRLPYYGRFYDWLRWPPLAGLISLFLTLPFIGLAAWVSAGGGVYLAFDIALTTLFSYLLPLLIAGVFGGAIVLLFAHNFPESRPRIGIVVAPESRSLRLRLFAHFGLFAGAVGLLLLLTLYTLLTTVYTQLTISQMDADAQAARADLPVFQDSLETLVSRYDATDDLLAEDKALQTAKLSEIHRLVPQYVQLLLVDGRTQVATSEDGATVPLTAAEETAVTRTVATDSSTVVTTNAGSGTEAVISLIVPLPAERVLVGRVPPATMQNLVADMQKSVGVGTGFVVDGEGTIIAHPALDQIGRPWSLDTTDMPVLSNNAAGAVLLARDDESGARTLVYQADAAAHGWIPIITVPYTAVLANTWRVGAPVAVLLLAITLVSGLSLRALSQTITTPMQDLINAAQTVASGGSWEGTPVMQRDDEIGQLSRAFTHMQNSLKQRLNELTLLLGVSHEVANSLDINQAMPALLRGALRGTGAAGARAIVANPSGGQPLIFGEGPAASKMATLDRAIAARIRGVGELMLTTPTQIRETLGLDSQTAIPLPALLAVPLISQDRFQGVMWLGYRQSHPIDLTERNLLGTLAGQAIVLVENARLFASAEGGRRRLAAVLGSTTDAVIVTDQTNRLMMVNRAAAQLLDIEAEAIAGLPVADVIHHEPLVAALTATKTGASNPEVEMDNGRSYYVSVSRTVTNENQIVGRVAVLHDITRYKEIDEMKSNFVADVSHDLRSPLTFMRGYATMLPMVGEMNEQQHGYLDRILAGIDQMADLVEDVLDLARIEAAVDLDVEVINPHHLLDDIAQEYWQHARLSGNSVEVKVAESTPPIKGDSSLIRRAITNLLTNAFKYAPESGPIQLQAWPNNGSVIISVRDRGPGIPKEKQRRLFEKFYRAKEQGTEKIKGSGLGLAIVKSIAERHGGWVRCESELGRGSTFLLSIPGEVPSTNSGVNGHHTANK